MKKVLVMVCCVMQALASSGEGNWTVYEDSSPEGSPIRRALVETNQRVFRELPKDGTRPPQGGSEYQRPPQRGVQSRTSHVRNTIRHMR